MFDPESKVKYMLDGLANIILRPNMNGLLTDYQKMKIGKYEIPISSCASLFSDEIYSGRPKIDNGEEQIKMDILMDELAEKFDEAKALKAKKRSVSKRKNTIPTRREKMEQIKKQFCLNGISYVRVDTDNNFIYKNRYYHISEDCKQYSGKVLSDGELFFDMDKIICAESIDGQTIFFDMNLDRVADVRCFGEQISFL